jgi:hypothetical protein
MKNKNKLKRWGVAYYYTPYHAEFENLNKIIGEILPEKLECLTIDVEDPSVKIDRFKNLIYLQVESIPSNQLVNLENLVVLQISNVNSELFFANWSQLC